MLYIYIDDLSAVFKDWIIQSCKTSEIDASDSRPSIHFIAQKPQIKRVSDSHTILTTPVSDSDSINNSSASSCATTNSNLDVTETSAASSLSSAHVMVDSEVTAPCEAMNSNPLHKKQRTT